MSTIAAVAQATHHLKPLISDLGLILMTAAVAVLLFKKNKTAVGSRISNCGFSGRSTFCVFPYGKRSQQR